jgi:hypothetical protein
MAKSEMAKHVFDTLYVIANIVVCMTAVSMHNCSFISTGNYMFTAAIWVYSEAILTRKISSKNPCS